MGITDDLINECICGNSTPEMFKSPSLNRSRYACSQCGLAGQWKESEENALRNWNEVINRISFTLTHVSMSVYLKVRKIYKNRS
jgi:hypothetical protein